MKIDEINDGVPEVDFKNMRKPPKRVTTKAIDFRLRSKIGSFIGRTEIQLIRLPPKMAPMDRNIIGVVLDKELSLVYWIGRLILLEINAVTINRMEYAAVIIVARTNIDTITILV